MPCGLPEVRELVHSFGIGTAIRVSWELQAHGVALTLQRPSLPITPRPLPVIVHLFLMRVGWVLWSNLASWS